jgi:hypothetical protein
VHTPEDYTVRFPEAEAFGDLAVTTEPGPDPRPSAAGLVWRRQYQYQPLISGTVEIPALSVAYRQTGDGSATRPAIENTLVSDAFELVIGTALTTQDSLDRPRDVTGTLMPPRQPLTLRQWATIVGSTLAALLVAYVLVRVIRRRLLRPPPSIPADVWALRELGALEAEDWLVQGRYRAYYYRLTEIVRAYIERKFAVAAAEMTTEEFLTRLASDPAALPVPTDRLQSFLVACDLVKYAALQPARSEAESALSAARAFVQASAAAADAARPPEQEQAA